MSLRVSERFGEYVDQLGRCEDCGTLVAEDTLVSVTINVHKCCGEHCDGGTPVERLLCAECADE